MKRSQLELKNKITEKRNILEGNTSRLGDTEECVSDKEDRIMEITQSEQQKQKQRKQKKSKIKKKK